ncbi:hypothetical protein B0H17DRAFT_1107342 [Mycena rosella]|uniref:Secreted protein n=1 Tax=Mycena rosella TaxID=1033263 RepID=A0AAD7FPD4_MYCRO|nr:hypothetical protein B0H17DRAFT_1107342 [Mycena rosella]
MLEWTATRRLQALFNILFMFKTCTPAEHLWPSSSPKYLKAPQCKTKQDKTHKVKPIWRAGRCWVVQTTPSCTGPIDGSDCEHAYQGVTNGKSSVVWPTSE